MRLALKQEERSPELSDDCRLPGTARWARESVASRPVLPQREGTSRRVAEPKRPCRRVTTSASARAARSEREWGMAMARSAGLQPRREPRYATRTHAPSRQRPQVARTRYRTLMGLMRAPPIAPFARNSSCWIFSSTGVMTLSCSLTILAAKAAVVLQLIETPLLLGRHLLNEKRPLFVNAASLPDYRVRPRLGWLYSSRPSSFPRVRGQRGLHALVLVDESVMRV